MTRYEFATLSIQTGTAAKVIAGVERYSMRTPAARNCSRYGPPRSAR